VTHIGLFEGIGGFSLAARWMGWQTVAWCEWNPFGQKILSTHFPEATGHGDISKTDFTPYADTVSVLTGGFPCQDASIAKQHGEGQQGLRGHRTGLLYEMFRAVSEIRPRYVVAENVENILRTNGGTDFRVVLSELARMGYNAEWRVCRASDVGAPHHRSRLYLVAYPNSIRLHKGQTFFSHVRETASPLPWVSDGTSVQTFRGGAWSDQPPAVCVDDGIPARVAGFTPARWRQERIRAYGNAVVPQIPYAIFRAIDEFEQLTNH
jgi:DNA (cytosine-5)-methyltransferase 1